MWLTSFQIDWDQVAADPVLVKPISNGHAAKMRWASRVASTHNKYAEVFQSHSLSFAPSAAVILRIEARNDVPPLLPPPRTLPPLGRMPTAQQDDARGRRIANYSLSSWAVVSRARA